MRSALIAGSIFLVLLITVLIAGWWVSQPMRFAGIERDASRAVAAGSPVEAARPDVTRREIVELLRARDFDALTAIIETRTRRALADPKEEWELGRVMDAFEASDAELSPVFDDWVQARPESYAPLLASATHRLTLAYRARGTRLARETTPEQFAGMQDQLRLLVEDVTAALDKDPQLSEAYVLLIDTARTAGTQLDCGNAAQQGLAIMPASFRIRAALAACRLPRWGGSYKRVKEIADAAAPFILDNPRLAALGGFVEWDRGRVAEGDASLGHFAEALKHGEHDSFYLDRAREHRSVKDYRLALDDLDAALKLAPDSPSLLVERLYSLVNLGRMDEVAEITELVEAIDPLNTDLPAFQSYALQLATYESNELNKDSRSGSALARMNQAIAMGGGDSNAYLVRGRAHLKSGNEAGALADFETAVRLDPANFTASQNLDYVLAKRGEWPRVIEVWNAYIARKPGDGNAIFERAGAYRHSGNMELAMRDARAACDLGVKQACGVAKQ